MVFKVAGMASVVRVDRRNGEGRAGRGVSKYTYDEFLDHSRNREDYIRQEWLVSSHSLRSMNQSVLLLILPGIRTLTVEVRNGERVHQREREKEQK